MQNELNVGDAVRTLEKKDLHGRYRESVNLQYVRFTIERIDEMPDGSLLALGQGNMAFIHELIPDDGAVD